VHTDLWGMCNIITRYKEEILYN